jgi:F-box-like
MLPYARQLPWLITLLDTQQSDRYLYLTWCVPVVVTIVTVTGHTFSHTKGPCLPIHIQVIRVFRCKVLTLQSRRSSQHSLTPARSEMMQCSNCGFISNEQTSITIEDLNHDGACDPHIQLQELDSQIAQARALIKELRRKRIPLNKQINRFHTPILRLPPELYSEIFTACVPEISWNTLKENATVPYSTTPLLIGMVCSAWRELAWSIPQLWSRISLCLDRSSPSKCDLMKEWIARSGQCQLSIHITCSLDDEELEVSEHPSISSMLNIITACSDRWFQIYFAIPTTCYEVIGCIRNRLPLLNFMSLRLNRTPWLIPFDGFDATPQLRHIEIDGYQQESMNLSLGQVTLLSLTWISIEECQDILARCPNLSYCSFMDVMASEAPWSPILAPQLEYLDIQVEPSHDGGALAELFDSLTIPVVCELRINNAGNELPRLKFMSMLSRSACSLQQLALVDCPCSELGLLRCFQAIPSLVHLEYAVSGMMNSVVYALDHNDPSNIGFPCLLPNLRSLTLRGYKVGLLGLVSMLSARWRNDAMCTVAGDYIHATQLQSVAVSHPDDVVPDASVLSQLRQLVAEGMEISLKTGSGRRIRTWL